MDIFGNTTQTPTIYHKKHEIEKSGFLGSSNGKESACNTGDLGSTPGSGRFPRQKGIATHSSILAWRIPQTEEPGGLQSTGSQRAGHDWATNPT